jgi:hypothetical protein
LEEPEEASNLNESRLLPINELPNPVDKPPETDGLEAEKGQV